MKFTMQLIVLSIIWVMGCKHHTTESTVREFPAEPGFKEACEARYGKFIPSPRFTRIRPKCICQGRPDFQSTIEPCWYFKVHKTSRKYNAFWEQLVPLAWSDNRNILLLKNDGVLQLLHRNAAGRYTGVKAVKSLDPIRIPDHFWALSRGGGDLFTWPGTFNGREEREHHIRFFRIKDGWLTGGSYPRRDMSWPHSSLYTQRNVEEMIHGGLQAVNRKVSDYWVPHRVQKTLDPELIGGFQLKLSQSGNVEVRFGDQSTENYSIRRSHTDGKWILHSVLTSPDKRAGIACLSSVQDDFKRDYLVEFGIGSGVRDFGRLP